MTETVVYNLTSAATGSSSSSSSATTSNFTIQASTPYLLLISRVSGSGDSVSSFSSSGLSPSLGTSSFTSVASQNYNTSDWQWAYYFTSSSSASGTGTITVHFAQSGSQTYIDLVALGGASTTAPVVTATSARRRAAAPATPPTSPAPPPQPTRASSAWSPHQLRLKPLPQRQPVDDQPHIEPLIQRLPSRVRHRPRQPERDHHNLQQRHLGHTRTRNQRATWLQRQHDDHDRQRPVERERGHGDLGRVAELHAVGGDERGCGHDHAYGVRAAVERADDVHERGDDCGDGVGVGERDV